MGQELRGVTHTERSHTRVSKFVLGQTGRRITSTHVAMNYVGDPSHSLDMLCIYTNYM